MDLLNVFFGIVTIASLLLSLWMYFKSVKDKALETEKWRNLKGRHSDLAKIADAVGAQLTLAVQLSRRDTTTIDEIRHLVVSAQLAVTSLVSIVNQEESILSGWRYGALSEYVPVKTTEAQSANENGE